MVIILPSKWLTEKNTNRSDVGLPQIIFSSIVFFKIYIIYNWWLIKIWSFLPSPKIKSNAINYCRIKMVPNSTIKVTPLFTEG